MLTGTAKQKKMYYDLQNVGLRAQATAVGLVQLCIELRRANLIDDPAITRIKHAIAEQITVGTPRAFSRDIHRRDVDARLDRLFAGEEEVGPSVIFPDEAPQP